MVQFLATIVQRNFNPRPREEGDCGRFRRQQNRNNFNPRPREEGDGYLAKELRRRGISIHALVKRATLWRKHIDDCLDISIHALVKRATAVRSAERT